MTLFNFQVEAKPRPLLMSLTVKPHLHHYKNKMGKPTSTNRDWTQIYAIYGMDQWQTLLFLVSHYFRLHSIHSLPLLL